MGSISWFVVDSATVGPFAEAQADTLDARQDPGAEVFKITALPVSSVVSGEWVANAVFEDVTDD